MYSDRLMTLARMVEQDPRHGYALLEHAVAEGAVRLLDRGAGTGGRLPLSIPRRIVQYWHSEDWPEDVRRAILKVRAFNPAMSCLVFHEQAARAFIAEHFGQSLAALFDCCFHHTMKSDLFRLCYLHVHGGIYVDVDIDCYGPMDSIFGNDDFGCFLFHSEGTPWCIDNDFIVTEPGNGIILAMIQAQERNLARYRDKRQFRDIWKETGPGVATETIMSLLARSVLTGRASLINGFLTAPAASRGVSFCHDELQYKATAEGNWRKAVLPRTARWSR